MFKKDYKKVVKRGYDTKLMEEIIQKLARGEQLPEKIKIILSVEIISDVENVILHRIGC